MTQVIGRNQIKVRVRIKKDSIRGSCTHVQKSVMSSCNNDPTKQVTWEGNYQNLIRFSLQCGAMAP